MVSYQVPASIRREGLFPLLYLCFQFTAEFLQVGLVRVAVLTIDLAEGLRDVLGNDFRVQRISHVMWISGRMNVSFGAIERAGDFEQLHTLVAGNVARCPGSKLRVSSPFQERRKPADLQLGAALDDCIRTAELHDITGLGIHEMRIFGGSRQNEQVYFIPTDFFGDGSEIGGRGYDV